MAYLIAQGAEPEQRWRRPLINGEIFTVGRVAEAWSTPWDDRISRRHVTLTYHHPQLEFQKLAEARNPLFHRGRIAETGCLQIGEHFVIGGTTFTLVDEQAQVSLASPQPMSERTFAPQELRRMAFREPDRRIAALARLPDLIATSSSDAELYSRLVSVVMAGIGTATAAALVKQSLPTGRMEVKHWDRRAIVEQNFQPSQRLIEQALTTRSSILHIWNAPLNTAHFTQQANMDWAFCLPLEGKNSVGYALYVTGTFASLEHAAESEALRDEIKFAELAATTFSRLREARLAERRLAGLSQFFSPNIIAALIENDPATLLAPREVNVSVLFCDLRGFTQRSEQSAAHLFDLLERVSLALSEMTRQILAHGGVIGDFHGDSAMGFWGWPMAQADHAERACFAALAIQAAFAAARTDVNSCLADFRVGIGIATGRAVAGKIGSRDQVKVTAFGPVVNLAARLESLTKTTQTPILLDEATRLALPANSEINSAASSIRKIGNFRLWGVKAIAPVYELAANESNSLIACRQYESAWQAVEHGQWKEAADILGSLPEHDGARNFLWNYLHAHGCTAPGTWQGAIELREK